MDTNPLVRTDDIALNRAARTINPLRECRENCASHVDISRHDCHIDLSWRDWGGRWDGGSVWIAQHWVNDCSVRIAKDLIGLSQSRFGQHGPKSEKTKQQPAVDHGFSPARELPKKTDEQGCQFIRDRLRPVPRRRQTVGRSSGVGDNVITSQIEWRS
ncbi:hypothetical protein AA309_25335 [Microvirga vignae]|uniref:Uncharacterized protein n=1 Tax=Microvirga vignae TaxID=1225564 RepID=A0A0H1RD60_9HYPH|nr:hypothetical protein AA309_25335 [Microvirga vignae]